MKEKIIISILASFLTTMFFFSPPHRTILAGSGGMYDTGNYTYPANLTVQGFMTMAGASSTDLTASHSFYGSFANGLVALDVNNKAYSVSTSTLTATSPLTGSFTVFGSGGSVGCQTASGSQAGCLSSTDWTTFNAKPNWPFTPNMSYGQVDSSTSTLIKLTGSPFSLVASSTVNFVNASTTQFTVFSGGTVWLANLTGPAELAIDSTGKLYAAATTSAGNPTGSVGSASATNGTALTYMRSDAVPACTAATASVPGCLAAADFTHFNNALASSSLQTSALLAGLLSDETGTGNVVFSAAPTFTGKTTLAAASTTDITFSNSLFGHSNLFQVNNDALLVGSSTSGYTVQKGLVVLGGNGTNAGSTTISMSKIQFDGYNSAGTQRVCVLVNTANALVVVLGKCTQ